MTKKIVAVAAALGMGLASASASAAGFINGSISFGGGFLDGALPAPPAG